MKIRIFLTALLLIFTQASWAQSARFALQSSEADFSETQLSFQLGSLTWKSVSTANGQALLPVADQASRTLIKGAPDLLSFSTSLQIPNEGQMAIEIVESDFEEIANINIAPSLGNLMRTENPSQLIRTAGEAYQLNSWFPAEPVSLRKPHIYRDFRGATLVINPVQYNPVTRVCRIYHHLEIKIVQLSTPGENELRSNIPHSLLPGDQDLLARHFLNFSSSRYESPSSWGKMLIISHASFMPSMQPFIDWKRATGMQVEMIDVATLGTTTAIANRIREEYNSNDLHYVILVGDIAQVPSPSLSGGASDPSYGYISGEDAYPEVMIGRFSVETTNQADLFVSRILNYEQASSGDHFSKNIGIASQEGPGDDNEIDFEHMRNMQADLLGFTYTHAYEFFEGSQGGSDAPGDPSAESVATALNNGSGLVLYTGHGSSTSFATSGFSNAQINQLENFGKLPVIWAVACVNGEFDNGTCFAEAWTRAASNGQPKGAATVFMSSINQSWDPPMCAQDEMVDVLSNLNASNTGRTFGSVSLSGCMLMNDEYGPAGDEMTNTWHIFGDPSLLIRTQNPQALTVVHPPSLVIGSSQITLQCNVEGARIALLQNGLLLSTGLVSGGLCQLTFENLSAVDPIQVTATAFNCSPYQGNIQVIVPNEPYLIVESSQVSDPQGNNNNLADYNETAFLSLTVENVGDALSGEVTGTVTESSEWVTLSSPGQICTFSPTTTPGQYSAEDCFAFQTQNGVVDGTIVPFSLTLQDQQGNTWNSTVPVTLHAPKFQTNQFQLTELNGNGNGRADAGETIRISIPATNIGSSLSESGQAQLTTSGDFLQLQGTQSASNPVNPGSDADFTFDFVVTNSAPYNASVNCDFTANFGLYASNFTFNIPVNAIIEDAESGNLNSFDWLNESGSPWFNDNSEAYEGQFSLRSGAISNSELTELRLIYQVAQPDQISFFRKISTEDGYDFLHFYIDGVEMSQWSGQLDWEQETYAVGAGEHEFLWIYRKDDVISANADAVWIDFIQLPVPDDSEGIPSTSTSQAIRMYPNPAQQSLTLVGLPDQNLQLTWMDVSGREILHQQIPASSQSVVTLNIDPQLAQGIYFLRFSGDQFNQTLRLLRN